MDKVIQVEGRTFVCIDGNVLVNTQTIREMILRADYLQKVIDSTYEMAETNIKHFGNKSGGYSAIRYAHKQTWETVEYKLRKYKS